MIPFQLQFDDMVQCHLLLLMYCIDNDLVDNHCAGSLWGLTHDQRNKANDAITVGLLFAACNMQRLRHLQDLNLRTSP